MSSINSIDQAMRIAGKYLQAGQLAQAEAIYRQVSAGHPRSADALHGLGIIALRVGKADVAADLLRRAVAVSPNFSQAHTNLGNALQELGQLDDAIAAHHQALALSPGMPEVHYNLANALRARGSIAESIEAYRRAIALRPDFTPALTNLGDALHAAGRLDEAIEVCRRAIALESSLAEAHFNLGNALLAKGVPEEAIAAFGRAVALRPERSEVHSGLGNALQGCGQFDAGLEAYRRAVAVNVHDADAHLCLGMALLLRGQFAHGWDEYEWRWRCRSYDGPRRDFPQPAWDGRPLPGATLLVHAEQGFGDMFQFVRYLPLVAKVVGKVIIGCPPELKRIVQGMPGDCLVLPHGQPLPDFDTHCLLLSLPGILGTTLESIPQHVPYLHSDVELTHAWAKRLAADSKSVNVGVAWAGSKSHGNDRHRSMSLSHLAPLAHVPGIRFYSLQKGDQADAAKNPPAGIRITDWTSELVDFADTAALVANLDLVITVDTAIAHLAGAMGRPVWTMLPFVPDWRWLLNRDDSPWYPSMRLFRQKSGGNWVSVVQRIVEELPIWLRNQSHAPRHIS